MRKLFVPGVPVLVALFLASCMSGPVMMAPAVPPDAVVLGERSVAFKADHDVIRVGKYDGLFRSLAFRVEKNDIEIFNVVVTYGNGEKEKLDTRLVFGEGSRSRIIPFAGGKRLIRTIAFTYKTVGSWAEGQARVVVYGIR